MKLLFLLAGLALGSTSVIKDDQVQRHELQPPTHEFDFNFNEQTSGRGGRIAYGSQAVDTQFPWASRIAISVSANSYLACTGSLISANFVVTARHCVVGDFSVYSIQVMLGAADTNNPARLITYSSSYTYWNPVDLALLQLVSNVPFSSKIQPIRLPAQSQVSNMFQGTVATIEGYGGGKTVLNYGVVTIMAPGTFGSASYNIVSQGKNFLTSAEPGDSGGPMTIVESDQKPTLIGVNVAITVGSSPVYTFTTRLTMFAAQIAGIAGIPVR